MGIYDRDYERGYGNGGYGGGEWRPEGQGGLQLRWPTTTVGWVLLVTIGVYLVTLGFQARDGSNPLIALLRLDSDWYLRPWRIPGLLTYGLLHAPNNLMHIAGNMFGFWLFGQELERRFGSREFLLFYLAAILCGGCAFSLANTLYGQPGTVIGASGGTTAVVVLCALSFPHQRVSLLFLPIQFPMWVLGVFIVVMVVEV